MKMKLNVKGLIAALLCLLLLCGCGAKTAPETVRKTPVAPVAPPETARPADASASDAPALPQDAETIPARTWPLTVTDDLGRYVTLSAPPEHVAAIIASFAETWLLAGGELSAAFSKISSPVSSMAPLCRS